MQEGQLKGGNFLLTPASEGSIFIPEDLNAEQKAIGKTTWDFFSDEVAAAHEDIEHQKDGVSVSLMRKAGELGLLMVEIPENYGGIGMDKCTATIVSENSVHQGSFAVTFMCQTGIGSLPILYFGTEAQKQKYLPKLATGEWIGAYALTEAGSGSDALGAKTKAVLSPDGKHYILNGNKMWITNGRWAEVFTVFAQVDGNKFTAFIVEKNTPGFTQAAEERKMGIKGSSTVMISFDDCKIPVENVLGEIGKGHKIAFNILNIGRWKLGAASAGACKKVLRHMIPYIKDRKQFGKSIAEFGMIKKKVADCSIRTFVTESIVYRIAGLYDAAIAQIDKNDPEYDRKSIEAIEEFAIEASIAKVYGSEALWDSADDGVQALGGYGFSAEYPMEGIQRDCRINRIFEGTNEINRLIIPGTILKRAMSGKFDLMGEIQKIVGEFKAGYGIEGDALFGPSHARQRVELAKKLAIYASGVAVQKYMADIQNQQYAMEKMADLVIQSFAIDSSLRRTLQLIQKENTTGAPIVPGSRHSIIMDMVNVFIVEAYEKMLGIAKQLLADVADNNQDELAKYLKALARFDIFSPINTARLRENIAGHMINAGDYSV